MFGESIANEWQLKVETTLRLQSSQGESFVRPYIEFQHLEILQIPNLKKICHRPYKLQNSMLLSSYLNDFMLC